MCLANWLFVITGNVGHVPDKVGSEFIAWLRTLMHSQNDRVLVASKEVSSSTNLLHYKINECFVNAE